MVGKKDDDTSAARAGGSHYDKSQVLQETRVFNETPLNPRKSRLLLGKVLALLYTGEHLTRPEATDLFFATTKLFQAKDPGLRQIVYLVIKELADKADDVLMVTSSLTKDINAKPDELFSNNTVLASAASAFGFRFGGGGSSSMSSSSAATTSLNSAAMALGAGAGPGGLIGTNVSHRADAIRALCRVTDPSMLAAIERFLKQAIVDTHAAVSTGALISAYHLSGVTKDIVRRWANEVQEAFTSPKVANPGAPGYSSTCYIVQYHALGLLYQIRQHDRMAVAKLVQGLARSGAVRSQWAQCLLVRIAVKCCEDESNSFGGKSMVGTEGSVSASMYEFLKALCNNNDMVMLEAARALCSMVTDNAATSLTATQVQPAIQALQQLLASPKPTLKFAALRTLNQLAHINPSLVASCNLDMESLVGDTNRSIATFAITTLLKTGTESSVDRLMKQIAGFMSEISDEFKVIVIDAIRVLAVKFPSKQGVMLQFLAGVLRDEGGYEYKKAVVEAIFDLVQRMPECLETALAHLCEFIEDCEFTKLAVRILNLLGLEGPRTKDPAKYLRYIYNRVILENSNVRAAAVTALASFGARVESVRPTVRVLLSRCTDDPDDEVRDRATLYLRILDNEPLRKKYLMNATAFALPALHAKLVYYTAQRAFDAPLDLAAVPRIDKREEFAREVRARAQSPTRQAMMATGGGPGSPGSLPSSATTTTAAGAGAGNVGGTGSGAGGATAASAAHSATQAAAVLEKVPELAPLVPSLFKSSAPVALTDKEMEYVVHVVKHVFAEWLVFEYVVINTVPDALLEQVTVQMVPDVPIDAVMRQMLVVPASRIVCGAAEPARVFVAFQRAPGSAPIVSFATTLKYVVKDCDPVTHEPDSVEGYNDEYNLEDVDLTLADYMLPTAVPDFTSAWSNLPAELVQTFQVPGTVHASVGNVLSLLGMQALEGSGNVTKDRASHVLVMAGVFMGGFPVLVRVRLAGDPGTGVTAMEFAARSSVPEVAQMVVQAVQG